MVWLAVLMTCLAAPAPEPPAVVAVVVDAEGRPRRGVEVWLTTGPEADGAVASRGRATTDARGRVTLPVPPAPMSRRSMEPPALWAYEPGAALAFAAFPWPVPSETSDPVMLTLRPAEARRIKILGPDGKPIAGVSVRPGSWNPPLEGAIRTYLSMPDGLAERLKATTNAAGEAVLSYLVKSDAALLYFVADGFGTQMIQTLPGPEKAYSLRPVGRVVGRVVADDPGAVRGVRITLGTQFDGKDSGGSASVRSDGEGRFEVPALAAALMFVNAAVPPGFAFKAEQATLRTIEAGRENRVEIALKRAVRVRGVVRERGTMRPIPGAWIMLGANFSFETVRSDAEGRFEALALPGQLAAEVVPWETPRPFFPIPPAPRVGVPAGANVPESVEVPAGVKEFTLPPIELARGDEVRGKVVGDGDRAVPGARVEGLVMQGPAGARVATTADADGRFVFKAVDPSRKGFRLEASTPEERTAAAVDIPGSVRTPVVLHVSAGNLVAPTGRVVDPAGKPFPGAEVEVWSREQEYAEPSLLTFDGRPALKAGADGTFRAPRRLRVDHQYRASARAAGGATVRSEWTRFRPGKGSSFPDLVVGRAVVVSGRVTDRQGKPIAGALVRSAGEDPARPEVRVDAEGRFRIDAPATGPAFLFAEAPGYRFGGRTIDPAADTNDLTLSRPDEDPPARPTVAMSGEEENRLALALIERDIRDAVAGTRGHDAIRTFELLARIDPPRALEELENARGVDPGMRDHFRGIAAHRLMKESPDEALAIIESLGDPSLRAHGYIRAADALPGPEKAKTRERLAQALLAAKGIKDPAIRLIFVGQVAGRMLAAGERDRAVTLLREGEAVAKEMSTAAMGGYARGAFAEDLARDDLEAALALTKGLSDPTEFDRHHGNIAHRLAATRPAEAERVWALVKQPIMRDGYALQVSHAMAPKDRGRARRIVGKIGDPYTRAHALGQMALALSPVDKAAASALLDDALTALAAVAGAGKETYINSQSAASTAAALLPVAERVDPRRVPEVLWRAVSMRGPRRDDEREEVGRLASGAVIAMMASRYDRDVARALTGPTLDRLARIIAGGAPYLPDALFAAPAFVDPRRAVALVEGPVNDPDPRRRSAWGTRRRLVARVLGTRGDARRKLALQHAGFWSVDAFDLVDDD